LVGTPGAAEVAKNSPGARGTRLPGCMICVRAHDPRMWRGFEEVDRGLGGCYHSQVGEKTVWPRNHVLLIRVGRPGGRRRLLIPVALAVVDDLVRSWLDLVQLACHVVLPLGVRLAGRRLGPVLKVVTGRTAGALDPRLLASALEGLWRVWRDVRRSGGRTLLELRPGDVDICVRLW